jgi:ubiquitin-like protein 4
MPKKIKTPMVPGSSKSVTIRLKSPRNPILEFSIDNVPLSTTTIQDLKDTVRERILDNSGNVVALDKIKILYKKKPVAGKTVADVLADEPEALNGGKEIEFGVMIIGGTNVVEPNVFGITAIEGALASASNSMPEPGVLQTDAFWEDLETFLEQRINDRLEAVRLAGLFKTTWHAQQ